jgi:hypothetical protein
MERGSCDTNRSSPELFGPDQPPESMLVLGCRVAVLVQIAVGRLYRSVLARRPGRGGTIARRHSITHWLTLAG